MSGREHELVVLIRAMIVNPKLVELIYRRRWGRLASKRATLMTTLIASRSPDSWLRIWRATLVACARVICFVLPCPIGIASGYAVEPQFYNWGLIVTT